MPRLTRKCQVTLPKRVREALGVGPGMEVEFQYRGGEWVLHKKIPERVFQKWRGYLNEDKTGDELVEEVRGE